MSSRTTRLASGLTWTLVTKFAIVKPRAAAAAGDGTTASRTASATSARAIPSAPERDAGRLPLSGAVELEVSPRVELEEGRDEVRREGLHRGVEVAHDRVVVAAQTLDRKSTRLNSSHDQISYAVFCLKKKKIKRAVLQSSEYSVHIQLLHGL